LAGKHCRSSTNLNNFSAQNRATPLPYLIFNRAGDTDAETTTIEGDAEQEYVWVDIADNGPGIPAETKASVIEKAYSGDADGTGIGLYLVNKFMQQYDGEIRIEDNSPRGTVVRLGFVPAVRA